MRGQVGEVDEPARALAPWGWIALMVVFIVVLYLASMALWAGTEFDPQKLLTEMIGSLTQWMMGSLYNAAMQMSTLSG